MPAVTARAVASLDKLVAWSFPLLEPGGRLLALKGEAAARELTEARDHFEAQGARDALVERAILTAYWLVSGYGLRAWRALAWLAAQPTWRSLLVSGQSVRYAAGTSRRSLRVASGSSATPSCGGWRPSAAT